MRTDEVRAANWRGGQPIFATLGLLIGLGGGTPAAIELFAAIRSHTPTLWPLAVVPAAFLTLFSAVAIFAGIPAMKADRVTLASAGAARPDATLFPASTRGRRIRSRLEAFGARPPYGGFTIWAADRTGLELWSGDTRGPVVAIPWSHLGPIEAVSLTRRRDPQLLQFNPADGGAPLRMFPRVAFGASLSATESQRSRIAFALHRLAGRPGLPVGVPRPAGPLELVAAILATAMPFVWLIGWARIMISSPSGDDVIRGMLLGWPIGAFVIALAAAVTWRVLRRARQREAAGRERH